MYQKETWVWEFLLYTNFILSFIIFTMAQVESSITSVMPHEPQRIFQCPTVSLAIINLPIPNLLKTVKHRERHNSWKYLNLGSPGSRFVAVNSLYCHSHAAIETIPLAPEIIWHSGKKFTRTTQKYFIALGSCWFKGMKIGLRWCLFGIIFLHIDNIYTGLQWRLWSGSLVYLSPSFPNNFARTFQELYLFLILRGQSQDPPI